MSTITLAIIDRMKLLENKISLLEKENKNLRLIAEVTTTVTTTPVSTVKAAKQYTGTNVVSTDQPLYRAPTFGGNVGGRRPVTFRATSLEPDRGTSTGGGLQSGGGSSTTTGGGGSSTTTGGGGSNPLPTGPDYNGDGVVDGADLGIFNSYYGQPGFDGAALGVLLTAMGQSTSGGGGGGQEPPPNPTEPSIFRKSGTSTKDIASLSGQRYIPYT